MLIQHKTVIRLDESYYNNSKRLIQVGFHYKNKTEDNLKLERRKSVCEEYRCDLTKELDDMSGISKQHYYDMFHHYILADEWCKKEKCLAIRVPGGTVGGIHFNDNNTITKIVIDIDYVVKTYPSNVNDLIQKYIGEVIEW
ncbi:hypothetical protein D7V90_08005 [bacterium 1xD42-87]|nr:hypothetical protein D7V90_08005 [bacterium 1xD42-87]